MNSTLKTIVSWVITLSISGAIGVGVAYYFTWHKYHNSPGYTSSVYNSPGYNKLSKDIAFSIPPKFNDYAVAINSLFALRAELAKDDLTSKIAEKLNKQLPKIKKQVEMTGDALGLALTLAAKQYGNEVEPSIKAFVSWKSSNNVLHVPYKKEYEWISKYTEMKNAVYQQLRKASGYYNIDSIDNALTMQLLPKAESALKANPIDPKLCTVMKEFNNNPSPETKAQIIAFVDIGNKYCDEYYHKKSSWGITENSVRNEVKPQKTNYSNNKYENIPYSVYYTKYVLPQVPEAMKKFEDKKSNEFICSNQGEWLGERNPAKDALRVAYRGKGQTYCPKLTSLQKKNFLRASYACMLLARAFCNGLNHCDMYERCKPVNGILFEAQ